MFKISMKLFLLVNLMVMTSQAKTLIDPTKPLTSYTLGEQGVMVDKQALRLQSVILSESTQQAIINNRRVVQGDSIAGYLVQTIAKNKVTLSKGDERLTLSLYTSAVLKK